MRTLYLDCVGGIAGDMLLASLIDAGASVEAVVSGLPPVDGLELRTESVQRLGVRALALHVLTEPDQPHRGWRDVRALIAAASMPPRARERAEETFARLAKVEARVHDMPVEDVVFHEVGALDAIADICGVALALEELDIDDVVCSPLPLGRGVIHGAHGALPAPAPATVELLRGADIRASDDPGETVTPTGAALVTCLASGFGGFPAMTLETVGVGAGSRNTAHAPNIVRAFVGSVEPGFIRESGPLILEANTDDLLPELVPDVVDACLNAGAHDVWTTPALMKHGRPGLTISALVARERERDVAEALLRNTTTLGLRTRRVEHRWMLERSFRTVEVGGHPISVKIGTLDGEVINIKPEHRDCAMAAESLRVSAKAIWTAALAQAHHDIAGAILPSAAR